MQLSLRTPAILPLAFALTMSPALADPALSNGGLEGYRSAAFGMTSEQVVDTLAPAEMVTTHREETPDGDLIIDGYLTEDTDTGVRLVFPAGRDQLALVVEFYPDIEQLEAVRSDLTEHYGRPWAQEMAEAWFEQLKDDMPPGAEQLVVWGGEAPNRTRFVRLWAFEDYLSVEYLDTRLLSGH